MRTFVTNYNASVKCDFFINNILPYLMKTKLDLDTFILKINNRRHLLSAMLQKLSFCIFKRSRSRSNDNTLKSQNLTCFDIFFSFLHIPCLTEGGQVR